MRSVVYDRNQRFQDDLLPALHAARGTVRRLNRWMERRHWEHKKLLALSGRVHAAIERLIGDAHNLNASKWRDRAKDALPTLLADLPMLLGHVHDVSWNKNTGHALRVKIGDLHRAVIYAEIGLRRRIRYSPYLVPANAWKKKIDPILLEHYASLLRAIGSPVKRWGWEAVSAIEGTSNISAEQFFKSLHVRRVLPDRKFGEMRPEDVRIVKGWLSDHIAHAHSVRQGVMDFALMIAHGADLGWKGSAADVARALREGEFGIGFRRLQTMSVVLAFAVEAVNVLVAKHASRESALFTTGHALAQQYVTLPRFVVRDYRRKRIAR